ncbi:AMP-dependent synthetase and ligase [Rhodotorula diobovata]|uniref:AMP-dependent synthetase and ligase n=1 Tax=Rhodotorula diobovata TaxID=5288 RepID=A0A5C5FZ83_9BASI|nr:AMP-dependent synthetase and ligase [Rhodotorula diobovata]
MPPQSNKPAERLHQVSQHLTPSSSSSPLPAAFRWRPALPADLPVNHTPLNPITFLLKAALIRPNHPALVHPGRAGGEVSWTYAAWAERVAQLAYALRARGLGDGDRVLVLGPNVPFVADALQAVPAAKGVLVVVNTRLSAPEVQFILENSGAKIVLVDETLVKLLPSDVVESGRTKGAKVQVVRCADTGRDDDPYEQFLREGAAHDKALGGKEWAGLEFPRDEETTMAITYTSGTTSRPKGVELTLRGCYLAAIANAVESRLTDSSRFLWTLPMFHVLGWCFPWSSTMAMCTQICLRTMDYSVIWDAFFNGVTHYNAAPTVQIEIVNHPKARKLDHSLYATIAGAAPTATLIEELEKLGITVVHVYGTSEAYGPMTRTYYVDRSSPHYYRDMAKQGHSFLTADDIRVVRLTPDGECPTDDLIETAADGQEVGEIVLRGNIVCRGYWHNEEATKKAFAGSFYHTGDLSIRYPDGTFAIVDRAKDFIISGGENVSSLAVENALAAHDDVLECAVVGRAHEKWGERPHAYVVLKPGSSWHGKHAEFEASVKGGLRGKISAFAIPEWIEVVKPEDLPKTSTGKIQKVALRERVKKLK